MCKHIKKVRSSQEAILLLNWVKQSFSLRVSLNKFVGLRPATLLEKRLWHSCFPVNFAEFSRTPFYRTLPATASENQAQVYIAYNEIFESTFYMQMYRLSTAFLLLKDLLALYTCLTQANNSLRDKCLTTEFFLVRIFQYSD